MESTSTKPSAPLLTRLDAPHLSAPDHVITHLSVGTMAPLRGSIQIVITDIVQTDQNSYWCNCQGKWRPTHCLYSIASVMNSVLKTYCWTKSLKIRIPLEAFLITIC